MCFLHFLLSCNTVWSPRYTTDIKAVERVQKKKRATKMITSLRQPYIDRPRTLKLPSLEYQRRRDVIQVYKIMHQKDRIDPDTFFQLAESTTRGHELKELKLNKPPHNTNLRGQIFSQRIITDWNSLPAERAETKQTSAQHQPQRTDLQPKNNNRLELSPS